MIIDQIEVYIAPNGLGRAAIVQRTDRLLNIYVHWKWSALSREQFNVVPGGSTDWRQDTTPWRNLYADVTPQPGLYETIEDARSAVRNLPGFFKASLELTSIPGTSIPGTQYLIPGAGLYVDSDYLVTGEPVNLRENGATSGVALRQAQDRKCSPPSPMILRQAQDRLAAGRA